MKPLTLTNKLILALVGVVVSLLLISSQLELEQDPLSQLAAGWTIEANTGG